MPASIGPQDETLAFLLGLPRSGTTLLSVMLENHPLIASPPEPWIMLALEQVGRVGVRHPANSQVLGTAALRFMETGGGTTAIRAAAAALYRTHLIHSGKLLFIDKTPRYALIPSYLARVFPDAAFIWLRRDPLDVAASYRTTWGIDLPVILAQGRDEPELFDLTLGLDRLEAFHADHPAAVHVVHYERLVMAAEAELAAVLCHLGHESGPDVIRRMTELAGIGRAGEVFGDPKILSTTAPHSKSIGSWRTVFQPDELQILLDAVGADRFERLGYGATVDALACMGIKPGGDGVTRCYHDRARACFDARMDDLARASVYGIALPGDVQGAVHRALHGEKTGSGGAENEECVAVMAELNATVVRLTGEVNQLREREAALLSSSSWRLTALLRWAAERLTRRA